MGLKLSWLFTFRRPLRLGLLPKELTSDSSFFADPILLLGFISEIIPIPDSLILVLYLVSSTYATGLTLSAVVALFLALKLNLWLCGSTLIEVTARPRRFS